MYDTVVSVIAIAKGSWRYRWIALALAWGICLVGWLAVYAMPDSYESRATVYVDTSSALEPLLDKMTVNTDVISRVEMVTVAMLGRPQLEEVARQTDLHLRAANGSELDELVTGMQRNISIANDRRTDPNLYVISFRDPEPEMTASVVSTLLNIFVEDSLGGNRDDTKVAQEFLREQIQQLDLELSAAEQALATFKRANVGRMPSEAGDYFARLQSEMDQLEDTQGLLRRANRRKDALMQQLSGESPTIGSEVGPYAELDARIAESESRLQELQLRFTDRHPDVVSLQETIEQLKARKSDELAKLADDEGGGVASDNPVFQNIQIELTNVNVEIATLREEEQTVSRKIAELRDLIDVMPQVEAELSRLTRDYDVKQAQYKSLLERLEMAELSESAEQSEDIKFRVIDPPFVPEDPVAPNRPLLLAGVLLVGLGVGGGLALLLDQINPVFSNVRQLEVVAGLPVLGSVQIMNSAQRNRWRRMQLSSFIGGVLLLCIVFAAVFIMHEPGSKFVRDLV